MIAKVTLACVCTCTLLMIVLRKQLIGMFTNDETVFNLACLVLIVKAINFIFDGMQLIFQSPIRAMGLQKRASYFAIGCYYLIGIPTSAIFAF